MMKGGGRSDGGAIAIWQQNGVVCGLLPTFSLKMCASAAERLEWFEKEH